MKNKSILFDKKYFFRLLDYIRIYLKIILTKLRLRDKQSCKRCGKDQHIIWSCKDEDWIKIPSKYHNTSLCLECFIELYPDIIYPDDIKILGFD